MSEQNVKDKSTGRKPRGISLNKPTLSLGSETELAFELMRALATDDNDIAPVFDEGDLYAYDKERGVWRVVDRAEASRCIQRLDGAPIAAGPDGKKRVLKVAARTVAGAFSLACDNSATPSFFASATTGLAFGNGFLAESPTGLELREHAPEHRARATYPFDYDPDARPIQFLAFLGEIFRDDADKQQRIAFVQELGGAAALGIATRFNKCGVFKSPGGGGRSQLGQIIAAAMPAGSVAGIKPQQFTNANRRALLVGKLLNVVDECPKAALLDADWFKQIVDGNATDAEHKYGTPFTFIPRALHLFFANELPAVEITDAFFRRVVVLDFTRQFHKDGTEVVKIANVIIAAELAAIVSWFMRGAERLIQQRGYTIPGSHEAAVRQWRHDSDSVAMFLIESTVLCAGDRPMDGHDWTQASILYEKYTAWCTASRHKAVAANTFGSRMKALGLESQSDGVGRFHRVRERRPATKGRPAMTIAGKTTREIPAHPGDVGRLDALTDLTRSLQIQKESLSVETQAKTETSKVIDGLDRLSNGNTHREPENDPPVKKLGPKVRKVRQSASKHANRHQKSLTGSPSESVESVSESVRGER